MLCPECDAECYPYRGMNTIAECPNGHGIFTTKDGGKIKVIRGIVG